jgi:hypothetical protein
MKIENIEIDNSVYFFALENVIRDTSEGYPAYEENILLPVIEDLLAESKIPEEALKDYPLEGYYYKSPKLVRYFKLLRNLQLNPEIIKMVKTDIPTFEIIHNVCSSPLFGPEVERRLTLADGSEVKKILPYRRDILTSCLASGELWNHGSDAKPFTLEKIWEALGKYKYNFPNLVELAYLTGNIVCVACAAETNTAVQEVYYGHSGISGWSGYKGYDGYEGICPSGCGSSGSIIGYGPRKRDTVYHRIVWKVDPAVEKMGVQLIEEYNKLMAQYMPRIYDGNRALGALIVPELTFIYGMSRRVEQPRVVRLHIANDGLNYNWLLWNTVKDFYSYKVITPQAILQDSQLKWAIMNGTYEDKPWDCNTPELINQDKPSPFVNKV